MDEMIDRLLAREGGLADDKVDRGGLTRYGISQKQYPTLDIRTLSRKQAAEIYARDYLRGPRINRINFLPLREQVFDFGVTSGTPRAIKYLQRLVNVEDDGVLGPISLLAINTCTGEYAVRLNNQLVDARLAFIARIVKNDPKQARFERGWNLRSRAFRI